jgi:DNA invertase Pin-like site-specific DNA recombinase
MAGQRHKSTTIALYARFSGDTQNKSSADDQLARLRDYLKRNGEAPGHVLEFKDEAVSGSVWKARPGVQKLLAAVKRREVSCVYAERCRASLS